MCSSKTETPVHSAAPIPTAAFFPKGVCVPWLRSRTVAKNLPQLGISAAALAPSFLMTQVYVLKHKNW